MSARVGVANRWTVLGRVLLFFMVAALLLIVAEPVFAKLRGLRSQLALGLITSLATLGVTLLFLRWDGLRSEDAGVAITRWSLPRAVVGFLLGLVLVAAQTALVLLAGHVTWTRGASMSPLHFILALAGYIALASREELAFRGYPLRRLRDAFGLWPAQLIVALVFALEHLAGGYSWKNALLGTFVGSLLFGMAAIATRGLTVPIGLHAAWNLGQWMLGEKETQGIWTPIIAPGYKAAVDTGGLVSYLIVFALGILGFWLFQQKRRNG